MRFVIEHVTRLGYDRPVREHQCELRVSPLRAGQNVLELEVRTEPAAALHTYEDSWGNTVHWFGIVEPHDELLTSMRARVETSLANPFDYEAVDPIHERAWIAEALWRDPHLWDCVLHRSAATPELSRLRNSPTWPECLPNRPLMESVQHAMAWVRSYLTYDPDVTHVHSSLAEAVESRAGVCQDFAHLLIAIVRSWGLPARYVVGYIDALAAVPETTAAQATHAWAQVLIPGAGWRGFDATNGLVVNDRYIAVAVGRDYGDAAPQRGSFKGDATGSPPEVQVCVVAEDDAA